VKETHRLEGGALVLDLWALGLRSWVFGLWALGFGFWFLVFVLSTLFICFKGPRPKTKDPQAQRPNHSFNYQTVVSKLDPRRQARGVAGMFDVVSDVRKERAPRLQPFDVFQRFLDPQVRRMFAETQTIQH
jgi:hypothetical protein